MRASEYLGFELVVPYPAHKQSELQTGGEFYAQPGLQVANQRSDTHFKQAQRHSSLVGMLKKALPVVALGLVIWFVVMGVLNTKNVGNITVKSTGISNGMLVMEAPKMSGFNRDNRPYDLSASRAKQDLKSPNIINMENLRATLPMQAKIFADIKAAIGVYNSDKEWLSLDQDIEINSQDGTRILLSTAEIDLSKGRLVSNTPVSVSTSNTNISADQVEVTDNGSVIVFKQRVRMTIQPSSNVK